MRGANPLPCVLPAPAQGLLRLPRRDRVATRLAAKSARLRDAMHGTGRFYRDTGLTVSATVTRTMSKGFTTWSVSP